MSLLNMSLLNMSLLIDSQYDFNMSLLSVLPHIRLLAYQYDFLLPSR